MFSFIVILQDVIYGAVELICLTVTGFFSGFLFTYITERGVNTDTIYSNSPENYSTASKMTTNLNSYFSESVSSKPKLSLVQSCKG